LESIAQLAGFENIFAASFVAAHPEQGTMTCRIGNAPLTLEVPLTRIDQTRPLRIGIRAGDILVAASQPEGLSARNILPGSITSIRRRDVMMIAQVNCGVDLEVHLTPAAAESLHLLVGTGVWLVLKTYSCQVMQGRD
jgi:molybdate transport system ATP-binding protein